MTGEERRFQFLWERPTAEAHAEGHSGSDGQRWSLREAVFNECTEINILPCFAFPNWMDRRSTTKKLNSCMKDDLWDT